MRTIQADNEALTHAVTDFTKRKGIKLRLTHSHTPQENSRVERVQQTVFDTVRTILAQSGLSAQFWLFAVKYAVYTYNRLPHSATGVVPLTLWDNTQVIGQASYADMHPFGCRALSFVRKEARGPASKLDMRGKPGVFLGYDSRRGGHWIYAQGKVVSSGKSVFYDNEFPAREHQDPTLHPRLVSNLLPKEHVPSHQPEDVHNGTDIDTIVVPPTMPAIPEPQVQESIAGSRPARVRRQIDHGPFVASMMSASPGLVIKISQALTDPAWKQSMIDEIDKLNKYKTWTPVRVVPARHKKLPLLWIFKEKANLTKKSRLTVRGHLEPVNPEVVNYAPVATLQARRVLLHLAVTYDWGVCLVDIESAFVNAPLKKIIFVGIPPGFRDYFPKGTVGLRLLRSLYGLRSSPANWNSAFDTCLINFGFRRTKSDPCVYVFVGVDGRLILSLHVDDALIASSSKEVKSIFLAYLRQFFTIKLEDPVRRVLGTNLVRTPKGFTLHMKDYTEKLLQAYGFFKPKPNKDITPMSFNFMQEWLILLFAKSRKIQTRTAHSQRSSPKETVSRTVN